jgi:hypothetical protein
MGSLMTGALTMRPSMRIAAFRPTFRLVNSANARADDEVILNEMTGSPVR